MGRSATQDLLGLLESVLQTEIKGILVRDTEGIILNSGNISSEMTEFSVVAGGCAASVFTEKQIFPSEAQAESLKRIINIYAYAPFGASLSRVVASAKILETITNRKNLDEVMHQLVSSIIINGQFYKAGIMFLNEALLELRGGIYCNSDMKIDITRFRNMKFVFESKNKLSDIMFFDKTDTLDLGSSDEYEPLRRYFCNDVLVTSLGIGGKPIGVLIVCKGAYSRADKDAVRLFGNICSLSIEYFRTMKRLELVQSELDDAKKASSNSDNLMQIGSLSATVAHEMRNPLIAIGGFAKRLEASVSGEAAEYLKIVQSETARLEKLVEDILSYTKRTEIIYEKINLVLFIDEIMVLLKNCFALEQINIVVNIPDGLYVDADRDKLRQVIMNIITNAVQEMSEGGDLIIGSSESKGYVTVSFTDTGQGVPPEMKEKIFEPFYTRKRNGTGLGLALCRKLMRAHDGDIYVSDAAKGAVFTLVLPKRG
ncbi:sensor histidine kinase [Seleniivibrio woodruffii]|uniref:sensor histidine kinase n=1 Tax=Seleniivibrio woodruffii TaxID=1078050 RepID=UPI0024099CAB|nr:HAMP domain-containing sensor histidine kinase [Seleniivibrio woodruffii]